MDFKDFLKESKMKTISVFDIDDTLFTTNSKIYYKQPNEKWKSATTIEFSAIKRQLHEDTEYDYSEFEIPEKIEESFKTAIPNKTVLQLMDKAIARGDTIGIVTARRNQKLLIEMLSKYLLYKDENCFVSIPKEQFNEKYIYAVGDDVVAKKLGFDNKTSSSTTVKAHVLQKVFGDEFGFDNIHFFDDDINNINAVNELNDKRITPYIVNQE